MYVVVIMNKKYILLLAFILLICMSSSGYAYTEFMGIWSSPIMDVTALPLVTHQFTLGFQVYTNESISNCSVVYAYMIHEPYTLIPLTFIDYDTVNTKYNSTEIIADNVTWNYITVTLPTRDEAESRYVADVVCEDVNGGYYESGCVSGCILPNDIWIYDYTERETTFKNIVAGAEFGYIVSGLILGLSENVSITEGIIVLIIIVSVTGSIIIVRHFS